MIIDDQEVKVIIAVFEELLKQSYKDINKYLGCITIAQMNGLYNRLMNVQSLINVDEILEELEGE